MHGSVSRLYFFPIDLNIYLYHIHYHNVLIKCDIKSWNKTCKFFSFVLFHNCFGYFRVFSLYILKSCCQFLPKKNPCWAISLDYIESIDQFGEIDLTILSLSVQHGVSVHLFRSYSFQYTGVTYLLLNLFINISHFYAVVSRSFSNFNFWSSIDVIQKYKTLSMYWPYILQPYKLTYYFY